MLNKEKEFVVHRCQHEYTGWFTCEGLTLCLKCACVFASGCLCANCVPTGLGAFILLDLSSLAQF